MTQPEHRPSLLLTGFKIAFQAVLVFVMLFCVFGFAASYEYPSINRYQILYTALLLLFSLLFYKLASFKTHKIFSTYVVSLIFLIWIVVLIIEALF